MLPATDQRPDPVNRALGGVGRAIGEGAERGDAFRDGRAGMRPGGSGKAVEHSPRGPERPAQRAAAERGRVSRA